MAERTHVLRRYDVHFLYVCDAVRRRIMHYIVNVKIAIKINKITISFKNITVQLDIVFFAKIVPLSIYIT